MLTKSFANEVRILWGFTHRYIDNTEECKQVDSLTGTNAWIIGYIAQQNGTDVYQKDIEKKFGITRSTVSKVIKLMEQKGFLRRESVPGDDRLKKLVLTEDGWCINDMMDTVFKNTESRLTAGFSDRELEILFSYLKRMQENMKTTGSKETDII